MSTLSDETRARVRRIAELMLGRKLPEEKTEETVRKKTIYLDEIESDIDTIIRNEAERIYTEETGEAPPKEIPATYKRKAMVSVLKRWQTSLKPLFELAQGIYVPPERAEPICPKCGGKLVKISQTVWRCTKCGKTVIGYYE